jgi:amino acid adenylation domain-containing protein
MSEQSLLTQELNEFIQRFEGRDISSPLRDASNYKHADKGRWDVRVDAFSGDTNIQLCIAAWHALLHWLRYDNDPVITCILNKDRDAVWPLVSEIEQGTRLVDLHSTICSQWPRYTDSWLSLDTIKSTYFSDHLWCHAICLGRAADNEEQIADFELVRDDHGWSFSGAKSTFGEAYLVRMRDFWLQLVSTMQTESTALLSEQVFNNSREYFCPAVNQVSGTSLVLTGNLVDRFHQYLVVNWDTIAIIDQTRQVTYAELDELSTQWAKVLLISGIKHGDAVGLVFPRNANMAIAQIAVLKTGAMFVPLDIELPQERLASMCADATIKLVLTEHACLVEIEKKIPQLKFVVSDKLSSQLLGTDTKAVELPKEISQDDAAYIIFTSGSTGVPKGVKVSHGNLLNFVAHFNDANYICEKNVVSQFAPYSFDASVAEIHAALLNSATLVILWKELIDSPPALQAYLTSKQVTFSAFPPQYLQHLSPEFLPTLKTLLTAGSAPNYELIKKWLPHVRYINAYGPTETTVLSTAWEADCLPASDEPISMGAPIANTHVRVVNRFGQSLPEGVTGELIIGGDGVVQGYINREQLNKEKFFQYNKSRWYKSGDLACFNNNRQLIFNGRVDDQIKLRGHRIEPGELESAVLGIDSVEMAAVVVHKATDTIQLVLFLQGEGGDEAGMRDALHTRIPHWAMPNRIVWLPKLPLTSNGKINYKLLREHLTQELEHPLQSVVYESELEQQVAAIWSSVLQRPSIIREDNFLFLGGDSLTA